MTHHENSAATVSVLIPVLDGRFLGEAIESVVSQEYRPLEIVVVDSSEGGTRQVVEPYGPLVRYEWQAPAGIGPARNRGVELASGELLTFLDSDDLFEPGRLRLQASVLKRDPSLEAVFGCVSEFVQPGLSVSERAALRLPLEMFPSHLAWTMLIRRPAFDRIGSFATDYVVGDTVEWYARARSQGLRSVMLDRIVARRRLHDGNTGLTKWDARGEFARIAREAVERHRSSAELQEGPGLP